MSIFFQNRIALLALPIVASAALMGIPGTTPQAQALPTAVTPGAASNLDLLTTPPLVPSCGGQVRTATPITLQAVINSAQPGDIVSLADGTYSGLAINISNQATESCPITIRPSTYLGMASPSNGVLVTNCGGQRQLGSNPCFYLNGRFVNLVGMRFGSGTASASIEIDGFKQRLWGNRWVTGAGDGQLMGCCPLVVAPFDWVNKPWNSMLPTMIDRYNRIEGNTVETQPRNGFYGQGHGVVGNVIGWNTLTGPPNLTGFETEAIKIGGDFANECTNTYVQFNTILNWSGSPYTIGHKGSCIYTSYNYLEKGVLQLRISNNNWVVGNQIDDGTIVLGGTGHLIRDNVIRASTVDANYGPAILMATVKVNTAHCNYDGVSLPATPPQEGIACPVYQRQFSNSSVVNNTFIDSSPTATSVINALYSGDNPGPPAAMTWTGNRIVRLCPTPGPGALTSGQFDPQASGQWTNNTFAYFPSSCGAPTGGVIGTNGNGTALGTWTPTAPVSVPFLSAYVNLLSTTVPTTTTSPTTTSTTTSTTTTTTPASSCVTVQSETGTPFGGAAVQSDAAAVGGQNMGWSAAGSGFTLNVNLTAGQWKVKERFYSVGGATATRSAPVGGTTTYANVGTTYAWTADQQFTAPGGTFTLTTTRQTGGLGSDQFTFCPVPAPTTTTSPTTTSTTTTTTSTTTTTVPASSCVTNWPSREAECASLQGTIAVENQALASGGKELGGWDYSGTATLSFVAPSAGTYTLNVRVVAPYGAATRTVTVNGVQRTFTVSSTSRAIVQVTGVALNAGANSVVFTKAPTDNNIVNLDVVSFT